MSVEANSNKAFARVQRTPTSALLCCCIVIPAAVLARHIDQGQERIEYKLRSQSDGIMIEIVGDLV